MANPTTRLQIPYPLSTDAANVPADLQEIADAVEAHAAGYRGAGLFSARPAAGVPGTFWYATDVQVLYYDNGTAWEASHFQPGDLKFTARATLDTGFLACDGSAVSRSTYAALFAAIGTAYGAGNGTTTFNLPDYRGRGPVGVGDGDASGHTAHARGDKVGKQTHQLAANESGVAAHSHGVNDAGHTHRVIGANEGGSPPASSGTGIKSSSVVGGGGSDYSLATTGAGSFSFALQAELHTTGVTIQNASAAAAAVAHENRGPGTVCNVWIKT